MVMVMIVMMVVVVAWVVARSYLLVRLDHGLDLFSCTFFQITEFDPIGSFFTTSAKTSSKPNN